MKSKKESIMFILIAALVFVATLIGSSYAYFVLIQGSDSQLADINASSGTTDSLRFIVEKSLYIEVTDDNFLPGKESLKDSTIASATLMANNVTNQAKYNYNVYLNISNNELIYSTEYKWPELLLQVKDPDGNEITEIEGLEYVTHNGLSGFDITIRDGLITIASDYLIETFETTIHKWNISIVLVNLEASQEDNLLKKFEANVIIQREEFNYKSFPDYIKSLYTAQGTGGLYYHDSTLENGAEDNSYRYSGATPNNYVCFETSNKEECLNNPKKYLYRIIGAFNVAEENQEPEYQVKLIRNSALSIDYWSGSAEKQTNNWADSTINTRTLNGKLPGNYFNDLDVVWSSKIVTHKWQVGGGPSTNLMYSQVKNVYNYEIKTNKDTTYRARIGLMYVSDYGYAASPENWTTLLSSYNNETNTNNNWLLYKSWEWTISHNSSSSSSVYSIGGIGHIYNNNVYDREYAIRPTFYLDSKVLLKSGTGTATNPYRIM